MNMKIMIKKENLRNNIDIIPLLSYPDANKCKTLIFKQNKGKSGIYRWNILVTDKSYIGSAKCLSKRFRIYYSLTSLKTKLNKGSSIIYSALLKYGYLNFSLDIIEYCNMDILIEREQYYNDLLDPGYNILKIAGSRLGAKHTEKTKSLISLTSTNRKHSEEAKTKMKELAKLRRGKETSFYRKNHKPESLLKISLKLSILVKVLNVETGCHNTFLGNKEAAKYLNIGISTLRRYKKLNKLIKGKYLISNV